MSRCSSAPSNEIRELNLAYLMLAQQMIREDRDAAMFRLGVSEEVADMIESLSPATAEYRFFGPVKEVTRPMVVRYCHIDYDREIALCAIREPKGRRRKPLMLGVARLSIETADPEEGEFAIVVRDAYQRRGIGTKLMEALIQAARDRHVRQITGHVLAANPGMLRFAESIGFEILPGEEPELRKLVLRL